MIKSKHLAFSSAILVLFCCAFATKLSPPQGDDFKKWHIANLSETLKSSGDQELIFMDEESMKGVYFELGIGKNYKRESSKDDIYYIHQGTGSISVDDKLVLVEKGSVLFVPAKSAVAITGVSKSLQVVITSMTDQGSVKASMESHSKVTIEEPRNRAENSWNPFIRMSNVIFGMYMLPLDLDGDNRLVHTWQELNIITSGSSSFKMDTGEIEVSEGSIFFVEEGNGHYFTSLDEDIDILILWEQR